MAARKKKPKTKPRARPPTMKAQSLLFKRSTGWTVPKARAWARSHKYKHGLANIDLTKDYVRIRQADPAEFSFLRTVTFGKGIKVIMGKKGRKGAVKPRSNPKRSKRTGRFTRRS